MKYQKEWIEAVGIGWGIAKDKNSLTGFAEVILDRLSEVGALKEPPKPRDYWICPKCAAACREEPKGQTVRHLTDIIKGQSFWCESDRLKWIHVREVLDETS